MLFKWRFRRRDFDPACFLTFNPFRASESFVMALPTVCGDLGSGNQVRRGWSPRIGMTAATGAHSLKLLAMSGNLLGTAPLYLAAWRACDFEVRSQTRPRRG